ncbi:hypothetical protein QTP70_024585, partial [Hemibagrus guttatus]
NSSQTTFEKWHTSYKEKVIREAESLTSTPMLESLLRSPRNQWHDESSESCPVKREHRISVLLRPLTICLCSKRSLEEQLENQEGHLQPYLPASGNSKHSISTFYIVLDKKLIPCQGTTSLAAFTL